MRALLLLVFLPYIVGCLATGEGNRQYNKIGCMIIVAEPNMALGFLNQFADSETGRDRTTKPSAELNIPVSAIPKPN